MMRSHEKWSRSRDADDGSSSGALRQCETEEGEGEGDRDGRRDGGRGGWGSICCAVVARAERVNPTGSSLNCSMACSRD